MDSTIFKSYIIEDRSYVSFIRREIHNLIRDKFTETRTGEIDIVVAELTSNLVKHALPGELLYRLVQDKEEPFFEIISIDNGTGIKDLQHSMRDGVSSKNTLGQGIGAITRLSNFSQIYSQAGWGTVVYCNFYQQADYIPTHEKILVRNINVAKPGEIVSGDGMRVRVLKDRTLILHADGLGHGEHAREAVDKAISAFNNSSGREASELLRELHAATKKTRGIVATVAVLEHDTKKWQICGIGNIYTRLQRGLEYKNYLGNNGIVGLSIPGRIENTVLNMEKFQHLIMCSDGIKTRWDVLRYNYILKYDPMILAAAIYKDHGRKTDDMSILIVRVI